MKYVYFSNDKVVTVTNLQTGAVTQFFKNDTMYETALELVKTGQFAEVEKLSAKVAVSKFVSSDSESRVKVTIEGNSGYVTIGDFKTPLHDVFVTRIIKMVADGFDNKPLLNFIANLYQNPSATAVNELFLFIEQNELPITEDGHLIAYKIVRADYTDIHSGTFNNRPGSICEMPRNQVDDNRQNTCSRGLHFCSRSYLSHYGNGRTDRCVLVKINPADVVSIPNDYNNAKGRTWRYEVVGEVEDGWIDTLPNTDYTASSVVNSKGAEVAKEVVKESNRATGDSGRPLLTYFDGYKDGYKDGYDSVPFAPRTNVDPDYEAYDNGYDYGYKSAVKGVCPAIPIEELEN